MVDPAPSHTADGGSPGDQYSVALGNFVYIGGAFRLLRGQVLEALNTAPPVRVRLGGNVALAKLRRQVTPIYPSGARATPSKGTVRRHVVLGVDGSPTHLEVVDGDPTLANSAMEAVQQWRYAPTRLNGAPVAVDTTIDVGFKERTIAGKQPLFADSRCRRARPIC